MSAIYVPYIDGLRDGWCVAAYGQYFCGPFACEEHARDMAKGLNLDADTLTPKREDRAASHNERQQPALKGAQDAACLYRTE
jgi:hypothetical protein